MGATRTPAAGRILATASGMFYRDGIRAVGVDAIAARAGVTKKTLYEKFGSKGELVAAYLRERDELWRARLQEGVERRGGPAKERLLAVFDVLGESKERGDTRGCGFVNATVELREEEHPARAVVMGQKRWLRGYLARLAAEAGAEDPEELADWFLILYEGVNVTNSLGSVANAAQRARRAAEVLIADL